LKERPDYEAQREREANARLSASATKLERLPTVAAFGDYGANGSGIDNALPTRTVGIQVRVPVFDGGRRDARRAESASQYRSEKVKTNDLKEQIELDVRLALDALQSADDQVKVSKEGLELADNELTQARRRYDAGVATGVEVTDAQTRLERARDNQTGALYNYNLARIDLAQAMGAVRRGLL
jgi:outer membrane protein